MISLADPGTTKLIIDKSEDKIILKIDILEALEEKISKNEKKYPVEKAKGKHTKYTKL